jgi:ubiquinone/menaquinone biosynthesis C-methylase UbiE
MASEDRAGGEPTPAPYDAPDGAHYDATRQVFQHSALHRGGYYDARPGRPFRHSMWQLRVRRIALSMLARDLRSGATTRVVDVGCGRGDFAIEVATRFPRLAEVWGTDFVREALEIARAEGARFRHVFFKEADILAMPFEDRAFDATLCINVLHHVHPADLPRSLDELARITGRCLILEIKNRESFYYRNLRSRQAPPVGRIAIFPTSTTEVSAVLAARGFRLTRQIGIFVVKRLSPLLVLMYEKGR